MRETVTTQNDIDTLKAYIDVCMDEITFGNTDWNHSYALALKAMEKQIPKKPITYKGTNRADCPACNATVRGIKKPFGDWCSKCGQKLDWSE